MRETSFDVDAVRARFSALDGSFAFFDAPGGTQVPDEVGAAVAATMRTASGNTGANYPVSKAIEAVIEEARELSARFGNCHPDEIIFGANMTTLNFTLSRTACRDLAPGDEILVTRLDHDANVAPWLHAASDNDLVVRHVDVRPDSRLDLDDLRAKLSDRTRIVAFPWAANSLGTITDAKLIADLAHQAGAIAWADAVQYAAHLPMDLPATGVDIVLFSAYKFCGPHLGIGYGRREVLQSWTPYKARPAADSPAGARFQTGSAPSETLGGLIATFRYLDSIGGMRAIEAWERVLSERFLAGLPAGTQLYGLPGLPGRIPIFLINLPGVPAGQAALRLAEQNIGVWSGTNYYSLGLYERMDWGEALRVGLCHYNTLAEVDALNAALAALIPPGAPVLAAGAPVLAAGAPVLAAGGPAVAAGTGPARPAPAKPPVVRTSVPATSAAPGVAGRAMLDDAHGCDGLHQRRLSLDDGARLDGTAAGQGEAWYVLSGGGRIDVPGHGGADLAPGTAVWLNRGTPYSLASGRLELVAVTVQRGEPAGGPALRVATLAEAEPERTGDREFRVLLSEGLTITQFVGLIPPGRAPEHHHSYDEVVHVLAGHGVVHLPPATPATPTADPATGDPATGDTAITPGTSIYLPPFQPHCLENTGTEPLQVLGVFYPAGSPAAKA
jgi:cysteine desulfurase family protein (TIGR01976 family)